MITRDVPKSVRYFLKESHRSGFAGRFLSRIRFLFMAEHQERFSDKIIAEMRGVSNNDGHSPFWQWLQEHFFSIDFPTADHLIGTGNKVFISELMPKYPIYTALLSDKAQAVIGEVHDKTKPALRLLQKEGFEYRGYVDLFDAGPTVEAQLSNIKTVKESYNARVSICDSPKGGQSYAICNQRVKDFRAIFSEHVIFNETENVVQLSPDTANALKVQNNDIVRLVAL